MDAWVLWVIAAVLLAVGEIATVSFFLAPFAVGAAIAALLDAVGVGAAAQWTVFLASALVLLAVVRPIARRHVKLPPALRTGTAALVGETGIVVERIDNAENVGKIRLAGQVWTARAFDDDEEPIAAGRRVHVMEIRGATALVTEI